MEWTIILLVLAVALTVLSYIRPGMKIGVLTFTVGVSALAKVLLGYEGLDGDTQLILAVISAAIVFYAVLTMLGWGGEESE